jgi:hypothetical protein
MAVLRVCLAVALILLGGGFGARAEDTPATQKELYERPVLVVEPGMHTGTIKRAAVDEEGRWAVTGSDDKTVRVWSLADGTLAGTIRLPAGPGNVGKVYAVAINPDGSLIAVGGLTRWTDAEHQEQIYLYDRATGTLVRRIEGLPDAVNHLAFSPDGARLAAVLGHGGLRVYARESDWAEAVRDEYYAAPCYGADFSLDGRLATTSFDGKIRLYSSELRIRPDSVVQAAPGDRPYGIAFSPDGALLAVGNHVTPAIVDRLDARTLARLPPPDLEGISNGFLLSVAWSRDGATLFAAGNYRAAGSVLAWAGEGAGTRRDFPAGQNTVVSLVPLPGGDLLVASQDPWLGRLAPDGTLRWMHGPPGAEFWDQFDRLSVSNDGTRIGFAFQALGASPARFDLAARTLIAGSSASETGMSVPRQTGLPVDGRRGWNNPTLGGKTLPLDPYETSRSYAVHPSGDRFVLGAEWSLSAFDAHGTPLWRRAAPGAAWAVNITGNGRLVVAAYADGTIRWHRMTDGVELLAFMPLATNQKDWVAWTPEGYYDATPGAQGVLRWQVNHDWDTPVTVVPVADIPGSYRPKVLPLVLQQLETTRALGLVAQAEHSEEVKRLTNSHVAPGTRLHLLSVGVGIYEQDDHLHLKFADHDASDFTSAIRTTQQPLYTVEARSLLNQDANRKTIMTTLASIGRHMEASDDDLAVVFFSGHGAMVGGNKLYLLPYDADVREEASLRATAISVEDLRDALLELAKHGRVLVLLDACHSGATTMAGEALTNNQDALKASLAAANITVLTSSSGSEFSREGEKWGHGAFTRALLDALGDPMADPSHIGLISSNSLAVYMHQHVPDLTEHQQTPGMEVRFESTVFALAN